MAKPQLEDGHTRIANEILEHLMMAHLAPNQWQVLLCIIRKTYGFHKKVDYIANKQIGEATGLCKAVVSRVLHNLEDMQLINRKGKYIGFQKDWEKWQELAVSSTLGSKLAEQSTSEVSRTANQSKQFSQPELAKQSTKVSSPRVTQKIKDTLTKDTIQKKDTFILPEWIDKETWEAFLEVRKKKKAVQTEYALSLIIKDLEKFKALGDDPNDVLKRSITNSWKGVFPLKGGQDGAHRRGSTKLTPRGEYKKPLPNPKLAKLVEQQRAADRGPGRDELG